jgi:hypothetical protein
MIYSSVKTLREDEAKLDKRQIEMSTEDLRLKTIQDRNTTDVSSLNTRVTVLESNIMDRLKEWIDQNYIRKPQR